MTGTTATANTSFDLVVIGAGPAGIAATVSAAQHGCSVCLLDEQTTAGGQIYRALAKLKAGQQQRTVLGREYLRGKPLIEQLTTSKARTLFGARVWHVGNDGTVTYSQDQSQDQSQGQRANRISGRHIIVANGAIERPFPLPGWTLPGVLTVGAAQILLKSSAIVADNAVLVGSGPLLYYFANQLIRAGSKPKALVDTGNSNNWLNAAPLLPSALSHSQSMLSGLSLLWKIRRAGVICYRNVSEIEIDGNDRVESIQFRTGSGFNAGGKTKTVKLNCDFVFLHDGVVPNTQISRSLRLQHRWNSTHQYFEPVTNHYGVTSLSNISMAGDGSGIIGAMASEHHGHLAALAVMQTPGFLTSGKHDDHDKINHHLKQVKRARAFQRFLATLYPPYSTGRNLPDQTIVCRCEQVTAVDIRKYVELGCTGPNQTKAFGRCGMGPCQGRLCSLTVTNVIAAETGIAPEEVGSYRVRSPLKPVSLAELASLAEQPEQPTDVTEDESTETRL